MLVLSRHKNEAICIGDNVKIIVVDICGDKVRLGIDAPVDLPVHRQEVYDAIQRHGVDKKQIELQAKQAKQQADASP